MKALKIIGIILLIILLIGLIGSFVAPTEASISKSVEINAPKSVVYDYVSKFENRSKWSPWEKKDPNIKLENIGEDGTVGAIHKWEGNSDVGKGEEEWLVVTADSLKSEGFN